MYVTSLSFIEYQLCCLKRYIYLDDHIREYLEDWDRQDIQWVINLFTKGNVGHIYSIYIEPTRPDPIDHKKEKDLLWKWHLDLLILKAGGYWSHLLG